ncbi:MAG TPA: ATP-binding protein [Rhodothermales bacterium]|nr:ATP-binding protein [Rhodothermales bacterium]
MPHHTLAPHRQADIAELRLGTCRVLCGVAVVLILAFWAAYRLTDPAAIDPLWGRLLAASIPLSLLIGTFVSPHVREHCVTFTQGAIYLLTAWSLALVAVNHFSPDYAIALLFCVFAFALCFRVGLSDAKPLLYYLGFMVAATGAVIVVAGHSDVSMAVFVACVVSTALLIFIEARSHLQVQNALTNTEQRFRSAVEAGLDAFFILQSVRDASGKLTDLRISDVNGRTEVLLSRERTALIGRTLRELFPASTTSTFLEKCEHTIQTGELFQEERHVNVPGLAGAWLHLQVVRIGDGVSIIARDITKTKDFEAELISAKEHAEEIAELKSAILANMSHEVRTPLTAILGFAQVLGDEVDEKHKEFVHLIAQGAQRLQSTLTSVLDLARLESDNYIIRLSEFDVVAHVRAVMRLFTPLAEQKGLRLHVSHSEPGIQALLDETALERVLTNLISNAIKFTEHGEVWVDVKADAHIVHIRVADTGIGISSSFMVHLFEEFKQESEGMSRVYEGTGLGLAITKRLLDYMGGLIEVESEKGQGTTFTVSLPRNLAVARPGSDAEMVETVHFSSTDGNEAVVTSA